ncbi:MAG: hypothetical protein ACI83O_000453 [Patescibacteria group bacterium]|jgi:hypothetical protein
MKSGMMKCLYDFTFVCRSYKRGGLEMEELVKLIIVAVVLIVAIAGISFLFIGRGGYLIDSIKSFFRFG